MTNKCKIHYDKKLTLETAKFLGVAVTWGGCGVAYKFVRTPEGYEIHGRDIGERIEGNLVYLHSWTLLDEELLNYLYGDDVDALLNNDCDGDLLLVEFEDDVR